MAGPFKTIISVTTSKRHWCGVLLIFLIFRIIRIVRSNKIARNLSERANRKRLERDTKRAKSLVGERLDDLDKQILIMNATQLQKEMEEGRLTSEKIVRAFCIRAKQVGIATNSNTEEFFEEAIEQARESDTRRRNNETLGLLEGLPISVKDQLHMKGADSTCGMAVRCFSPHEEDGLLVKLIRAEGGIPFVKTNVPQSLLLPETDNNIFGKASNPWNLERSPGGSTGGEAALLCSGGSVLGVGTDVGGSLRIPAHFTGITSFKPTPQRVSKCGAGVPFNRPYSGQEAINSVAGPMGRCVEDLLLILKTWWNNTEKSPSQSKEDPSTPHCEFRQEAYNEAATTSPSSKKLRIGYYVDDGWFAPSPPCERAVLEAKEALEAKGHTLIPFKPFDGYDLIDIYTTLVTADGGMTNFHDGLQGESLIPYYLGSSIVSKFPRALKTALVWIYTKLNRPRAALLFNIGRSLSTVEYQTYISRKNVFIANFLKDFQKLELDAILSPGGTLPAFKHGGCVRMSATLSSYFLYNLLHWPSGIVPTTTVSSDEQYYPAPHNKSLHDVFYHNAHDMMKDSAGLPISVQIASPPFHDEECLGLMKQLQSIFPPLPITTTNIPLI